MFPTMISIKKRKWHGTNPRLVRMALEVIFKLPTHPKRKTWTKSSKPKDAHAGQAARIARGVNVEVTTLLTTITVQHLRLLI